LRSATFLNALPQGLSAEVTRRMRKRDFRSCSISDFFNDIDVNRSLRIEGTVV
jgi:hypothetical protein